MANTVSLSIDISITDVGVLNDDTTFSFPQRVDAGVFVKAFKVNFSAVQTEIPIVGNSSGPEADAFWTFDILTDGWYQFFYASIPEWEDDVTYALYDAVFDEVSGLVYQSLLGSNLNHVVTDPVYWVLVPTPAELSSLAGQPTEPLNADLAIYQRILTPKVDRLYGDAAVITARECCADCEREENVDAFEIVFALREGALISEERLEYSDGEKMIRRLDEFIIS